MGWEGSLEGPGGQGGHRGVRVGVVKGNTYEISGS